MGLKEGRSLGVPRGGGFVHLGDAEEGLFGEGRAEELESDGERFGSGGEATGKANGGDGGDVGGDGEDIEEIHLEWVSGFLADGKGGNGGGWAEDRVALLEGVVEVAADERADFECAEVVGIVVA